MKSVKDIKAAAWVFTGLLALSLLLGACSAPPTGTVPSAETPVAVQLPATVEEPTAAAPTETQPAPVENSPEPTVVEQATAVSQPTETDAPEQASGDSVTSFPNPDEFTWTEVVNGLDTPVDIGSPNDGTGRLFILEKVGRIRIVKDGSLSPEPFMDITDRVVIAGNEMGLLGIAFHPDFSENGYFYVNYTAVQGVGETHISRFQVSSDNPDRGDAASEQVLLVVSQPFRNHNGGGLAFGPDGFLYIGLGDGGSANDPQGNGQSLSTHLGKLLRIDVDQDEPYGIPADNPFAGGGGMPEIWAYGLRNPWRFSFDSATGDLWVADVGQNQWEEVDYVQAGAPGGLNFGWDFREGTHPFEGEPPAGVQLTDPVFEYDHGVGCSITGGYVYRGQSLPEFYGVYVVGDFCSGRIWGVIQSGDGTFQSQELFSTNKGISSFGQDEAGELYLLDMNAGVLFRLDRN